MSAGRGTLGRTALEPHMARNKNPGQPDNFNVGDARVQVVRGPHKDDDSVWYWRTTRRSESGKWEPIPGPGWATKDQAEREVAKDVGTGEASAVANHKSRGRGGRGVTTVSDLLIKWLADSVEPKQRAGVIARRQRDRLYEKGLPTEDPSRRRSKAQTMGKKEDGPLGGRSAAKYKSAVSAIQKSPLGSVLLLDVARKPELLEQYRDARQTANPETGRDDVSPNTVGMELKVLSIAWNWGGASGRGYTFGLALKLPHLEMTPVRDQETPTRETLDRVLDCTPRGDRLVHGHKTANERAVWVLLHAHGRLGCRIEALERLLVREVEDDGRGGRARLFAKKHDRIVRLPQGLVESLRPLLQGREGHERVFEYASRAAYQGAIDRALDQINGVYNHYRSVECPKVRCVVTAGESCRGPGGGENRFHKERKAAAGAPPKSKVKRFTSHGVRRRRSQEAREGGMQMHVYMRIFGHTAAEALRAYGQPTVEDEARGWEQADGRAVGNVIPLVQGRRCTTSHSG